MSDITTAAAEMLRHMAAEASATHASVTRNVGTLFVSLHRYGRDWSMELCDEQPIAPATMQEWRKALGVAVSGRWTGAAQGRVLRLSWQGTEDEAPEGAKATWIGGKQ